MEAKHKHLEFIQAIIARLANTSFVIKGWAITLVAGFFAFAAENTLESYAFIAWIPVVMFWGLDGYFLWQERQFKKVYAVVRKKTRKTDYSLKPKDYLKESDSTLGLCGWLCALVSPTLSLFYVVTIISVVVVNCLS